MRNKFSPHQYYLFLSLLFYSFQTTGLYAQSNWQKAIDRFVADPQLSHASVSIAVMDRQSGKMLGSHAPQQSLIPASTLKVITTATALALLGEGYQFVTRLEYDGHIDAQGVLQGNVYLTGSGDPTLASAHFDAAEKREVVLQKFVQAIQTLGISRIEGQIVGDAACFDGAPLGAGWSWEDTGNYYGSGAWGLNWQENYYFCHLQQKKQLGTRPDLLQIEPEIPNLLLINELTSAEKGSGDNAYIFGGPYAYTRIIRGTIPVGSGRFTIKGSIPDPPFFAAYELSLALAQAGISCSGGATSQWERERIGNAPKQSISSKRQSFYEYTSPRLIEIAREANFKSVNIYCEALLRTLGKEKGKQGSATAGIEVVKTFMEEKGIDLEGFFMEDGSGLSPGNALSAYHLTEFLRQMALEANNFSGFYESLPVGGRSGTLKGMFKGSIAEGRIRGKSGGMERVRSYTGYIKTPSGKELVFALIANNYTGNAATIRQKMERLMIEFCRG